LIGRAFGKVILLGEHAVVYGVPAIAVGIDRGATATASPRSGASTLALGGGVVTAGDGSDLGRAFADVLAACGAVSPLEVVAETDLPAGAGLGCSAALGVAIARAIDGHLGHRSSPSETFERAMAWERVFHGNPSGVDATVAARGGCIRFVRGKPVEPVRVGKPLSLAIGYTGLPSSTKSMVESVARLRERRPEVVDKAFEGVRSLVENARLAIEAGDHVGLGKLLDLNQMILSGVFVSSTEIERMCDLARGAGALGAKLTGAGGGGCVIALLSGAPDAVLAAWTREGFTGFSTVVEAESRHGDADAASPP
jgi:mevalonate kinase